MFLYELPRCSAPMAEQAVRDAAIEFCSRARVLSVDHSPISTVAGTATYSWSPGTDLVVVDPERVWYEKVELTPVTKDQLASMYPYWPDEQGEPRWFTQENRTSFILIPKPSASVTDAIRAKVFVAPSRSANEVADELFERYAEAIAAGAKARLFSMRAQHWYSPDLAIYNRGQFEAAIGQAAWNAATGYTRAPVRTRVVHSVE